MRLRNGIVAVEVLYQSDGQVIHVHQLEVEAGGAGQGGIN